jgi:hypothetical protein
MLLTKYQNNDSVPPEGRFNWLFGFTALKEKLAGFGSACFDGDFLVPIRPFLNNGETFDPETIRLLGVAFEMARAAVKRPGNLSDEIIARRIIELAKAGERNVDALCEAALNARAGAVSAPNLAPLPASRFTADASGFFILSQSGERPER